MKLNKKQVKEKKEEGKGISEKGFCSQSNLDNNKLRLLTSLFSLFPLPFTLYKGKCL
jgi:hypothetical protein